MMVVLDFSECCYMSRRHLTCFTSDDSYKHAPVLWWS